MAIKHIIGVALAVLPLALALPAPENTELVERLVGEGMKWNGPIFPGEEDTVLWGSAKDIYEQITAINPDYNPTDSYVALNNASTGVEERNILEKRQYGQRICGNFATGDRFDLNGAISYLWNLGGNCGTPAYQCRRMTCQDTTGTYICNDRNYDNGNTCAYISGFVNNIVDHCCGLFVKSGQLYHSSDGYSVYAGYANCNHGSDRRPPSYVFPGPNGSGGC